MTANREVVNSPVGRNGKSLSPLAWWFAHDPDVAQRPTAPPKPPPIPAARDFMKAVREFLGADGQEISQNYLADWIQAERSMVGRWEMEEGGNPSWPYIGRILILLGVLDATGKLLRLPAQSGQAARAMGIEDRVLAALRQLPEEEKLDVLQDVTRRAHEASASQAPAALKKG